VKSAPFVCIIVLNWNGAQDTLECLKSLKELTYPNFSVLVVDNASSDGSVETLKRDFPDLEIIVNSVNLRFAGGNNAGIKRGMELGAEYLLLLNNDTVVKKDFLTHLVEASEKEGNVGMVGPKIYYYGHERLLWYAGGKIEFQKGWISHIGVREIDNGQYDEISETAYVTGCCVLVSRLVVEKVGMLDEAYYIYGEDADWSIRTERAGFRLLYVPGAVIWHKLSVSSGGHLSWFKNWNKLKSQMRLMARYARPRHWITIPFHLVINILKGLIKASDFEGSK